MTRDLQAVLAPTEVVCLLGEGPFWHDGGLRWVDIEQGLLHRLAAGEELASMAFDDTVGMARPRAGGGHVAAVGATVVLVDADGDRRELVRLAGAGFRCNDGACDVDGNLYVGTMPGDGSATGALHRVSPTGQTEVLFDGLTIPNGLAFDEQRGRAYYIDSADRCVSVFDPADRPWRRVPWVRVGDERSVPDGLTLDAEANVWVAVYGGGRVDCFSPSGQLVTTVALPVQEVTACAFGGPALTDLYVTTARAGLSEVELAAQPAAGRLFVVPDAGEGLPVYPFAG